VLCAGLRVDPADLVERVLSCGATGLHLGHETCCRLMPSSEFVGSTSRLFAAKGLDFALVTPAMVPETELSKIGSLLSALPDGTEVVANDWGVLHTVASGHQRLEPVAGRMLCASRVDPRVPRLVRQGVKRTVADELLAELRQPPVVSRFMLPVLERLRVRRVELNPAAQGLPDPLGSAIKFSLHQPWALVSASRYCPQQRLPPRREPVRVLSCTRECLQQPPLELHHRGFPDPLYLVSNAVFARADVEPAGHPQIDRMVIRDLAAA